MILTSTAFDEGGRIPSRYTCDSKRVESPSLEFLEVPRKARSLVLLMDDPDVPHNIRPDGVFDHWVVFNIPPRTMGLETGKPVPPGAIEGMNGAGRQGYAGPCPPDREHRYFFRLYAIDTILELSQHASKNDVLKAIDGHVIAKAELMGRYERGT